MAQVPLAVGIPGEGNLPIAGGGGKAGRGDGWYDIIDSMCNEIARTDPACRFEQIKEKFGTLRVYAQSYTKEADRAIRKAEEASAETCEACGAPGSTAGGGWIRTLCTSCREDKQ